MPNYTACDNFPNCQRPAQRDGKLCAECQRRADEQAAAAWKFLGWTRHDERRELQGKKGKK